MNQLKLTSTGLSINNENIASESFSYSESICSDADLRFGSCEVSAIKCRIRNTNPVIGRKFNVQLGSRIWENRTCYVDNRTADRCYRDIELYDALYDVMAANVSAWYNALLPENDSTVTLQIFRDSFFEHYGITQEYAELVNDSMNVFRTIDPEQITGKTVMNAICELNGCFGRINDAGKFEYVFLSSANPKRISSSEMANSSAEYADYTTEYIDKIQIRQEENDIGASYGTGNNCYVIQGNFLVFGKSSSELISIASNIYSVISTVAYRPFKMKKESDLSLNAGDCITFQTNGKQITSYVLEHEIKGIQSLTETIQAKGSERQQERRNSLADSILQIKGKSNVLERSIEETKLTIKDVEQGLSSRITQNAGSITSEIERATSAEDLLNSRIVQTDDKISLEVSRLQKEIDGDIKTYNVDYVPTLMNYPAWDFCEEIFCDGTHYCDGFGFVYTDASYSKYARTTVYNEVTMTTYKFSKGENGEWYFREVADSDYAMVMQQISEINITVDSISSTVSENKKYSDGRFSELSSSIVQTKDSITAEVKRATQAEGSLSSRITATVDSISAEVTRATQEEVKLSSSIKQTADSITSEVTRATNAEGSLSSRISQNADAINLRVIKGNISSEISQEAGKISIKSNRFSLQSTNCTISENGTIKATNAELSGKITSSSGKIGGFDIGNTYLAYGKTSFNSSVNGIYIGTDGLSFGGNNIGFPALTIDQSGKMKIDYSGGIEIASAKALNFTNSITSLALSGTDVMTFDKYSLYSRIQIIPRYTVLGSANNYVGFFGDNGSTQKTVAKILAPTSATVSSVATKLNDLLDALKAYNLIKFY